MSETPAAGPRTQAGVALSQSPFAKPLYRPYSTSTSVSRAAPAPPAPSTQQGSTRAPPVEKNFIARLPDGSELAVDVDQAAALAAKNFDVYPAGAGLGALGGPRRDDGEDGGRAALPALQASASTSGTATAGAGSAGSQTATAFVKARGLFPDERHSLMKTFGSELHPAHGNGYGRRSGAAVGDHAEELEHEDLTPASPLGRVAKRFLESRVAGMVLGDVNADPLGEAVFDKIGQKNTPLKTGNGVQDENRRGGRLAERAEKLPRGQHNFRRGGRRRAADYEYEQQGPETAGADEPKA
mmetsp:Transcript_11134/g.27238  ORF Transcript_11134/g.27238 Transcript_11134/m.27238 type:complete len:298 (-) Transcript_11134:891-1784(-)